MLHGALFQSMCKLEHGHNVKGRQGRVLRQAHLGLLANAFPCIYPARSQQLAGDEFYRSVCTYVMTRGGNRTVTHF